MPEAIVDTQINDNNNNKSKLLKMKNIIINSCTETVNGN